MPSEPATQAALAAEVRPFLASSLAREQPLLPSVKSHLSSSRAVLLSRSRCKLGTAGAVSIGRRFHLIWQWGNASQFARRELMAVSDQSVATTSTQLDQLCINTIRTLSMDAVQKANSGHPGAPMGLAPVAYCLWQQFLRYDPEDPHLAQPRPLRALQRPRLHAALFPDPSGGRARSQLPTAKFFRRLPSRSTRSRISGNWAARRPGIPNTA